MKNGSEILSAAEEFIWRNARLLDRQRFAFHFQGGSREAVRDALVAYQNPDGGFGNALEPDIRCPDSQPVPAQHALEILDEIGFNHVLAERICDYLAEITTEEGGVPFVLPSVMGYPHAPWWSAGENPPASLNPTAALAGILHKNEVHHSWLEKATDYCWAALDRPQEPEMHLFACAFPFLQYAPDRAHAQRLFERYSHQLMSSGLVADAGADGYVSKPLDWAANPDSICRPLFSEQQIEANLDDLVSQQGEDGGWPIAWPPVGPGAEMEWRGWVTIKALKTLRAYGRI